MKVSEHRSEHRSEHWPEISVHQEYWEQHNCWFVYSYDPTDDGPEVQVIRFVNGSAWR
jgi:hypothetical protein